MCLTFQMLSGGPLLFHSLFSHSQDCVDMESCSVNLVFQPQAALMISCVSTSTDFSQWLTTSLNPFQIQTIKDDTFRSAMRWAGDSFRVYPGLRPSGPSNPNPLAPVTPQPLRAYVSNWSSKGPFGCRFSFQLSKNTPDLDQVCSCLNTHLCSCKNTPDPNQVIQNM